MDTKSPTINILLQNFDVLLDSYAGLSRELSERLDAVVIRSAKKIRSEITQAESAVLYDELDNNKT